MQLDADVRKAISLCHSKLLNNRTGRQGKEIL
jgi:hypothetical protein